MTSLDEEDEVVEEIDVYLSNTLSEKLYLFEYPLKPINRLPDTNVKYLSAKIKPKQQKVQLEVGIDTHSSNYDRSRGEQIALNVDGIDPTGEPYFQSSKMDKHYLVSSKTNPSKCQLAVCLLKQGELHINQVHCKLSLRPSFGYLDKSDLLSKRNQSGENPDDDSEPTAVTLRVADSERIQKIKEKSYNFLQQKNAHEQWINMTHHSSESMQSKLEKEKLLCTQMQRDVTQGCNSYKEYLKQLAPGRSYFCSSEYFHPEQGTGMEFLQQKHLTEQVKHIMLKAHVLTFDRILRFLGINDYSAMERSVQQVAIMVQGCWVVKSDLVYPENSLSPLSGISSEVLRIARDYMLYRFTKSRYITRSEISSAVKIPNQDIEWMINTVAKLTETKWEFKYPFDIDYVTQHRSVEKGQHIKWEMRYKKLLKEIDLGQNETEGNLRKPILPAAPSRQKKLSRSSLSEDGDESGVESTSNSKEPRKRNLSGRKRPNVSPSKHSKAKQFHIATLAVSPTFFETAISEEAKAELKNCVSEAMRSQFCMTLGELKEAVLDSPLNNLVDRNDFQKILEEVLVECGAKSLNNKWPQNTTPEPLYAFTKFGNKVDRYRNALLDLYSNTARSRINFLIKKVEDEFGEIISEADSRQIFEDYCIYKSGFYYLKGTISPDT